MNSIADFEDSIDPEINESQIEKAMKQIELFEPPTKDEI